jgi:hypothetical protein
VKKPRLRHICNSRNKLTMKWIRFHGFQTAVCKLKLIGSKTIICYAPCTNEQPGWQDFSAKILPAPIVIVL